MQISEVITANIHNFAKLNNEHGMQCNELKVGQVIIKIDVFVDQRKTYRDIPAVFPASVFPTAGFPVAA